jgi:hypothetical protein
MDSSACVRLHRRQLQPAPSKCRHQSCKCCAMDRIDEASKWSTPQPARRRCRSVDQRRRVCWMQRSAAAAPSGFFSHARAGARVAFISGRKEQKTCQHKHFICSQRIEPEQPLGMDISASPIVLMPCTHWSRAVNAFDRHRARPFACSRSGSWFIYRIYLRVTITSVSSNLQFHGVHPCGLRRAGALAALTRRRLRSSMPLARP